VEEATLGVKVDAVNQNPTLNATLNYNGAERNTEFEIAFADLAYKLDVKDAEVRDRQQACSECNCGD